MTEQTSGTTDRTGSKSTPAEGISAFLGRLLDQLSLSAWLPAAMLVGSLAVMLQLRSQQNHRLIQAVTILAAEPWGLLILLLFAIILATMVTQAFQLEVIRVLEGYWGNGLLSRVSSRLFIARQRRKLARLVKRRDELKLKAFQKARLLEREIIPPSKKYISDLIEDEIKGRSTVTLSRWRAKKKAREAEQFDWQEFAPADLIARLDAVEEHIDEFPRESRLLPTKLGNVLRTVEDSLPSMPGSQLERFVIKNWEAIPSELRKQHDQWRTRLDLYCTLVFVFLILGAASPAIISLGRPYLFETLITAFAYLAMSLVSYSAAVTSARGFGTALKTIMESVTPAPEVPAWRRFSA